MLCVFQLLAHGHLVATGAAGPPWCSLAALAMLVWSPQDPHGFPGALGGVWLCGARGAGCPLRAPRPFRRPHSWGWLAHRGCGGR